MNLSEFIPLNYELLRERIVRHISVSQSDLNSYFYVFKQKYSS